MRDLVFARGWLGHRDSLKTVCDDVHLNPARMVKEECKRRKWTEADLKQREKGNAGMVKIARRLQAETVMTQSRPCRAGWMVCTPL